MYRLRSIEGLIGKHKELQAQEIYLATPEELNDPLEGAYDLQWIGDSVLWNNFLKHFLMVLIDEYCHLGILGEEYDLRNYRRLDVLKSVRKFKTEEAKKLYTNVEIKLFEYEFVSELISFLSKKNTPTQKYELKNYLKIFHHLSLSIIESEFENIYGFRVFKFLPFPMKIEEILPQYIDIFRRNKIDSTSIFNNEGEKLDDFFSYINEMYDQIELIALLKSKYTNISNSKFYLFELVDRYLEDIELMLYPNWFTACFMSTCEKSSIWGYYADGHKGVCLKFKEKKDDNGNYIIELRNKNTSKVRKFIFHEVIYHSKNYKIDFFKSLGKLPGKQLNDEWYTNIDGTLSNRVADIFESDDLWRNQYWMKFEEYTKSKTSDWKSENERRILTNDFFSNLKEKDSRKWVYDFNDLEGIVFGAKTSNADKVRIIEVIMEKCKAQKRNDFKFYQARVEKSNEIVKYNELKLLQFKFDKE